MAQRIQPLFGVPGRTVNEPARASAISVVGLRERRQHCLRHFRSGSNNRKGMMFQNEAVFFCIYAESILLGYGRASSRSWSSNLGINLIAT
jgi:hypothetical protein